MCISLVKHVPGRHWVLGLIPKHRKEKVISKANIIKAVLGVIHRMYCREKKDKTERPLKENPGET